MYQVFVTTRSQRLQPYDRKPAVVAWRHSCLHTHTCTVLPIIAATWESFTLVHVTHGTTVHAPSFVGGSHRLQDHACIRNSI